MLVLDNLETADAYTRELTLESKFGGRLVYVVANQSAVARFRPLVEIGGADTAEYGGEVLLTPQSSFIDKISAVQFRSAVSGSPARIIAQLSEPGDILPASGTPFTGTLAASGAVGAAVVIPRIAPAAFPPANPTDQEVISLEVDVPNGVVWLLQYRASANDWEYIGGSPLFSLIDAAQSRNSNAYGDLGTIGPSVTVPLAGDYWLDYGCGRVDFGGNDIAYYSPSIAGAAALDTDAAHIRSWGAAGGEDGTPIVSKRVAGLAASAALVMKYRSFVPFNTTWAQRWLKVQPIRLTP